MQMMLPFYQANIKLSEGYILHTLDIFAGANGQKTNMKKIQFFPIQCDHINLDFLAQNNLTVSSFPSNYLGLPLHTKKIPKHLLVGSRILTRGG
jgi:myo-inositol-hexaphosphate 3-phosphohydrolase